MKKFKKFLFLSLIFVMTIVIVGCNDDSQSAQTAESYKVVFNSKGGTSIETQTVKVGKKVKKPTNPKKDGYIFLAWYLSIDEAEILYDFDKVVDKNLTLIAKWKLKEANNTQSTIKTLSNARSSSSNLTIDNITKAKKEIKNFDVVSANPTLQSTAVNGKCLVEWENREALNSIVRDVNDSKVNLTAIVTCGSKRTEIPVVATIKKSMYTYQTIENEIVTIINVLGATDYTVSNDSTTAKYLAEAEGAQILTTFHNDDTNYLMWFNDINTKYVVKAGV